MWPNYAITTQTPLCAPKWGPNYALTTQTHLYAPKVGPNNALTTQTPLCAPKCTLSIKPRNIFDQVVHVLIKIRV